MPNQECQYIRILEAIFLKFFDKFFVLFLVNNFVKFFVSWNAFRDTFRFVSFCFVAGLIFIVRAAIFIVGLIIM